MSIPVLTSVSGLASGYDVWLCDIWGVLHNGIAAYVAAADACAAFRKQGGHVVLVSNAPRPAAAVAAQLAGLGITSAHYDAILTSGDVTRALLKRMDPLPLYLLGPARHSILTDGLGNPMVAEDQAGLVLCSGLFETSATETPEDYRAQLERMARRGLRMICANPDLTAEVGDSILYCAGSLAQLYEQLGGNVVYAGKPHAAVYADARAMLATLAGREIALERILAVGDGVNTDIRGAASVGIDALYIASRIHMRDPFSADAVARLFAPHAFAPKAAMAGLAW